LPKFKWMNIDRPEKGVYRVTINRPEKLNAFNFDMYDEFSEAITEAEDDDDVKVIIVRGAGTSFGAGQDLSQVGFIYGFGTSKDERRPSMRRRLNVDRKWAAHYLQYLDCSKLTIAQVHGHCLGTHFEIMTTSDFAIASDDANIGHPGLRLVGPGLNFNMATWIWAAGWRLSKEMMFTGRTLSGVEAADKGLVNKAVPLADLDDEVLALAKTLTLLPADGVVMAKEALRVTYDNFRIRSGYVFGSISHTMNTNARFEPDEFNFFRERRETSAKDAFHQRDKRYADRGKVTASGEGEKGR
jgi:enoyl-CoA hydratase